MRRWALLLAAVALALLVWLPLGVAGVPLDTPDGFLHLGGAVGWARQIRAGWLWPTWSDLPWAGAGSSALLIYPPLFRWLLGVPLLLGLPVDQAMAAAVLAVLLINNGGAALLARLWLPPGPWRLLLVFGAGLNPYLLVNLYVRGAWPEALAQGLLWWLAIGLLGLSRRQRWGVPLAGLALAAVLLSNWNSALLTLLAWGLAGLLLARPRAWALSLAIGLGASAAFWLPALRALPTVRPPIPEGLFTSEFFFASDPGSTSMADLLWIQAATLAALLLLRWLAWGSRGLGLRRESNVATWGLLLALLSLLLMLPLGAWLYQLLPPLQRIQFPWRWLGPGWCGTLLWLASAGTQTQAAAQAWPGRRLAAALIGLTAAAGWFDGLWRFRENLVGHAPSPSERLALRKLLACDPLQPCPAGLAALPERGELAKRFAALPDGRIALSGVPDYSPTGLPEGAWNRRLNIFWLPAWPQTPWAAFSGAGQVQQFNHGPWHRELLVQACSAGSLRLMQWAQPRWQLRYRRLGQSRWSIPARPDGRDPQGWISLALPAGSWQVRLDYK